MATVTGTGGGDLIQPGTPTTYGSDGNDLLYGAGGNDTIYSGVNDDTVYGGDNRDRIYGGDGGDQLYGDANADFIYGGLGDDTLFGGSDGGNGDDSLYGGGGFDYVSYSGVAGGVNVNLATSVASGADGSDAIFEVEGVIGGSGADTITGSDAANFLDGGGGADSLSGGLGIDTILGGAGNDTIYGGLDNDSLVGGADTDTLTYATSATGVNANLSTGIVTGEGTDTVSQFENLIGSIQADTLAGDANANTIQGLGGNDRIDGGGGADSLDGGIGNDTVAGDLGNDTIIGGVGEDSLYGGDDSDTLFGGIDNDMLFGGAGSDRLDAGSGSDTLAGGAGSDVLIGGVGSDTADYSASGAGVNVTLNDTLAESGGDAAGDTISGIENIIGSSSNDTLTGDNNANEVFGGGGADSITGNLGSDSIEGGAGNDTINAGPDTLGGSTPAPANEFLDWTTGAGNGTPISQSFTQDTGTMSVSVNYVPGVSDQYYVNTGAIYSPEALIADNSGAVLGRTGAGEMTELSVNFAAEAGSGMTNQVSNVQFRISDIDTGGWIDQVTVLAYDQFGNLVPATLSTSSTEISISGGTATATGNGTTQDQSDGSILVNIAGPVSQIVIQYTDLADATQIIVVSDIYFTTIPATADTADADTVVGGLGDDQIETGIGADLVYGDEGLDTLRGEAGNDTLFGGVENDLVYGGSENDLTYGGADQDTLYGDAGNDTLYGEVGNDLVYGGDNADLLYGGVGLDTLYGDAGNDTLFGDAGNDSLTGGAGTDSIFAGDDRDQIFVNFTGSGNAMLINDVLGNESIDGGSGAGTSADNDTLTVDTTGLSWTRFDIAYQPGNSENGTITFFAADGTTVVGTVVFTDIERLVIVCFTAGTQILTDRGAVAVEELGPGDLVVTRDNGLQPLRWVGSRTLSYAELLARPDLQPVRIAANAFAGVGPERTMLVSPQHRVLIEGARAEMFFGESEVLVPAKHLTGMAEVTRALPVEGVTYVHILFDRHEIVQSEGIWTESFQPAERTLGALEEAARAEVLAIFPELALDETGFPAARLSLRAHEAKVLVSG